MNANDDPTAAEDELDRLLESGIDAAYEGGAASDRAAPSDPEAAPDRCGRFVVTGKLARGGIGVVFRARDEHLGRDVAIKVLRRELLESPVMVGRFLDEARVVSRLQHPGTVPVYEIGIDRENRPFIAMKLIEGRTLAELLKERGDDFQHDRARLLGIFQKICETVAYAHGLGIIHRDLKPANVMIGAFGEVQVVDWGLAKVLGTAHVDPHAGAAAAGGTPPESTPASLDATLPEGPASLVLVSRSLPGTVAGTPAYMPPEQACGQVHAITFASDVFSLGAILCEILTGAPPYTAPTGQDVLTLAAAADLGSAWGRLRDAASDAEIRALAFSCLQPLPADRPVDAAAIVGILAAHFEGTDRRAREAEIAAAKATVRAAAERKARRLTLALGALFVGIVGLAGWFSWKADATRREDRRAHEGRVRAALHDVARLTALESFPAAEEALQRAREPSKDGDEDPALAADIATAGASLVERRDSAVHNAALKAHEQKFLGALREIRETPIDIGGEDVKDYRAAFEEVGIRIDTMKPSAIAAVVRAISEDVTREVVAAMDDWAGRIRSFDVARSSRDNAQPDRIPGPPGGRPRGAFPAKPPESVITLIKTALILDPDPWRCRLREAVLAEDVGTLKDLAGKLGEPMPDSRSLVLLASCLDQFVGREPALEVLREAVRTGNADFWVHHHLAVLLSSGFQPGPYGVEVLTSVAKDLDEALRHAWIAASLHQDSVLAWEHLTALLLASGNAAEARRTAERAASLAPARIHVRALGIRTMLQAGEVAAAHEALKELPDRPNVQPRSFAQLVMCVVSSIPQGDAIPLLGAVTAYDGEKPQLWCALAALHFDRGDFALAEKAIGCALVANVRFPDARASQAAICLELGRYSEANEAILGVPEDPALGKRAMREELQLLEAVLDGRAAARTGTDETLRQFARMRVDLHRGRAAEAAAIAETIFATLTPSQWAARTLSEREPERPPPGSRERAGQDRLNERPPGGPGRAGGPRGGPLRAGSLTVAGVSRSSLRDAAVALVLASGIPGADAGTARRRRDLARACLDATIESPPESLNDPQSIVRSRRLGAWKVDHRLESVREPLLLRRLPGFTEEEGQTWARSFAALEALNLRR